MVINDYFINGQWQLLYYKLLLVIIYYITTIGDYSIINYCWIFYVIISQAIGSYYISGYLNSFTQVIIFYSKLFYLRSLYFILNYFKLLSQDKIIYNNLKYNLK